MDVSVNVGVSLSSEKLCRSSQSVALVTTGSCVVKTIFVKGVDGSTVVHRVKGHTVVGDLLDCTVDVCVTYNGKKVEFGDTMTDIGIGNHDTLRCCGRVEVVHNVIGNHRLTFLVSGRAWRADKNGFGL